MKFRTEDEFNAMDDEALTKELLGATDERGTIAAEGINARNKDRIAEIDRYTDLIESLLNQRRKAN